MAASALVAEHLPADLEAALSCADWQIRCQAVSRATGLLKGRPGPDPVNALLAQLERLAKDSEWQVRQEGATALEFSPSRDADETLSLLAKDPTSWVSQAAKESLRHRARVAQKEERECKRVASALKRVHRLQERCSPDLAREIEEAGMAYYQAIAFGCSHDVLTLATSVQYSIRLLGQELARRKVPKKVWADTIETAVRRCQIVKGISKNMRALARQAVPPVRKINLRRAIDEALGIVGDCFAVKPGAPRVEVELAVARHLRVEVPRERLVQALVNLLQNAYEAIDEAGTVRVAARQQGELVVLELTDTGCGILAEEQQVIFFPGKSTKKGRLGTEHNTGWGLSLARKFVEEDCQGRISLESERGTGTRITVVLPTQRAEEDEA